MEQVAPKRKTSKSRKKALPAVVVPEVDYEALEREIQKRAIAELKNGIIQSAKLTLLRAIRQSTATHAYVEYEGSGDSGDSPSFVTDDQELSERVVTVLVAKSRWDGQGRIWAVDIVREERSVSDAATELCEQLIERNHAGYEDGEGGAGQLNFHPLTMTVEMECTDYFRESKSRTCTV